MQIRLFISTLLLASAIRLYAGASGGGTVLVAGTITPGPGATFTQFDYVALTPPLSIVIVQQLAAALPPFAAEFNALLAGPTDAVNVLNGIGFSNGSSQPFPVSSATLLADILQAAATSGLLAGLNPTTASITAVNVTTTFVRLSTFEFVTLIMENFTVSAPTLPVAIMIKPTAMPPVPINPGANGTIPVAVLSTATFDATTQVDRTSVTFGHTGTEASLSLCNPGGQDVNGDGLLDLVCHFYTQKTGFIAGDRMGFLQGKAVSGVAIQGSEAITIAPR